MRHMKVMGLALIAVFALVAFAGATSASATRLCRTNLNASCASGDIYAAGTRISASSTNAVLTTTGGAANPTLTCRASTTTITTTDAGGGSGVNVRGQLSGLTFTSCSSTNPSGCSSSATVTGLPTTGFASWTSGFNGDLTVTAPVVSFTCPILGFPVTCSFGNGGTVTGQITGGNPATVRFTNQAINSTGGFGCPTAATWNATYTATSPTNIYVTDS